jgi:hypothetical protein
MRKNVLGAGFAVVLMIGAASTPAWAEAAGAAAPSMGGDEYQGAEPSPEGMAFDGVLVRPISLLGSLISTAFFVVSLPFSATGGNVDQAAHSMVAEPFRYTFKRPLGADE